MSLAPDVPTEYTEVDEMLEMLSLKPDELLCDPGCGDGRILIVAANKYGVRGLGVEIRTTLVELVTTCIKDDGLGNRIKIIEDDVLDDSVDLSEADAVAMYLTPDGVNKLKYKLESQLKPGCRVVSKDYPIEGWKPIEIRECPGSVKLYLYKMGSS